MCTFQGPRRFKHHQNSTKRPQERERRKKIAGGGKKTRNSGPPPFEGPTLMSSQNSTSKNWPKSKLAEVKIGRSRSRSSRTGDEWLPQLWVWLSRRHSTCQIDHLWCTFGQFRADFHTTLVSQISSHSGARTEDLASNCLALQEPEWALVEWPHWRVMERAPPPDASRQGCELPGPVLLAKNSLVLAKLPSGPSNLQELVPLPRKLTALSPIFEDVPWHWSTWTTPLSVQLGNALLGPDDELLARRPRHPGVSLASLFCLPQLRLQKNLLDFHHLQTSSFAIAVRLTQQPRGPAGTGLTHGWRGRCTGRAQDPTRRHLHGLPPVTWHGKTSLQKRNRIVTHRTRKQCNVWAKWLEPNVMFYNISLSKKIHAHKMLSIITSIVMWWKCNVKFVQKWNTRNVHDRETKHNCPISKLLSERVTQSVSYVYLNFHKDIQDNKSQFNM